MLAIVADRWDPDRGGRERYAADLVAYLRSNGREVACVTPHDADARDQMRVLALTPVPTATHYQLHGGLLASAFDGERQSMQSMVRRVLFGPALTFNRRRQRLLDAESRLLEGTAALMAFSEATASELVQRGVHPSRIVVSRPGVDTRRFYPASAKGAPDSPTALRLAFVGHNFALKGLHSAIGTVAMLRRDGVDASLTVAGHGPTGAFRRLAEREGIAGHVRFAGAMSQDAVATLLRASDGLLHPTFYDPFPRVVIEALACGCPVITTARCGAAEVLTHDRHGFVVHDPADVVSLAEAAAQLTRPARRACVRQEAAKLGQSFDQHQHFCGVSQWIFGEARA